MRKVSPKQSNRNLSCADPGVTAIPITTARPRARFIPALAASIAATVFAAACGSSAPNSTATPEPVVVSHSRGETTIPIAPQRIVALSPSWADNVLALGVTPVGIGTLTSVGPADGKFPWQGDFEAEVIRLPLVGPPDYGAIAAAAPDLILADHSARDADVYRQLSAIAPTIAPLEDSGYVDHWRDQARALGRALRKDAEAHALVTCVETRIATARGAVPQTRGATFVLAVTGPESVAVVADPADPAVQLMHELGLSLLPAAQALGNGKLRTTVSYEHASSLVAADLALVWNTGGRPVWNEGQLGVVPVDGPLASALSDPSPLNIAYTLDVVSSALQAITA